MTLVCLRLAKILSRQLKSWIVIWLKLDSGLKSGKFFPMIRKAKTWFLWNQKFGATQVGPQHQHLAAGESTTFSSPGGLCGSGGDGGTWEWARRPQRLPRSGHFFNPEKVKVTFFCNQIEFCLLVADSWFCQKLYTSSCQPVGGLNYFVRKWKLIFSILFSGWI